jgi:hypothetical protein
MSHIVTIRTEIRDATALTAACRRLSLAAPVRETVKLFSGEATGHAVRLRDWRYPVVCHLDSGQLEFDNYEGRWGDPTQLDNLKQAYAIEKARIESRKQGHTVTEQPLDDGSVTLTINVGSSA